MAFVATCSSLVFSQGSSTSSLSGVVLDPAGEFIAGAQVTAKNKATGAEFRAVTADNGTFSIPALDAGTYAVTISARGFKQSVISDVKVDAATPAAVRVPLEVGNPSESVVVEGGAEIVQTQSATISTTLKVNQIASLPLQTRNALDFIVMLPGTNTTGGPRGSTINGLPQNTINITIDGVNTQDNFNKTGDGFFSFISPRLDSIEEVTVSTATPGAESAGEGAVQIKFVTRRGNNELHGSAYEYHRNPWLNSNYWFNNRDKLGINNETGRTCDNIQEPFDPEKCKAPRDRVLLNQFGFRVGGPIVLPKRLFGRLGFDGRNKAFFFVNYEEFRQPTQISRVRTILSPLAQAGTFQYNVTVGGQTQVRQANLLEIAQRTGCSGCTTTIDPVVGKLLADIRSSTTNTGGIVPLTDPNLQSFTFANTSAGKRYYPTIRFDFNLSANHHLENVYNYQSYVTTVDTLNSADPTFPGFPNHGGQYSNRFSDSLTLRSTLRPTLVNEARFGMSSGTILFFPDINPGNFTGALANQGGFSLAISLAGITNATARSDSSRRNAPVWQLSDGMTWTHGAHSVSFGGSFTQANMWVQDINRAVPAITFGINTNDPANVMFNSTNAPVNFPGASNADITRATNIYAVLTGHVTAITASAYLDEKTGKYTYLGDIIQRGRMREWGVFAQDAWRMRPNLTLNYGLRWELQGPFTPLNSAYSRTTVDDLFGVSGPGNLFKPGTLTGRQTQLVQFKEGEKAYNTDYKNFAPTFGFAWSPSLKQGRLKRLLGENGQTVLRGGYSIAYNRNSMSEYSEIFGDNPGSFLTADRNLTIGNLVGGSLGSLPVLLRETNRLGAPAFPAAPVYPITGAVTDEADAFDPNLKVPYSQSWTFGIQREITKDMALEVRYVGTRNLRGWTDYNFNAVENNIRENGLLNEFKLAQANLQANIAAGRGGTFRYFGAGTGTSPLPITLAYFSGKVDPNVAANYTSSNFTSTTFVNQLALYNPLPGTYATNLHSDATRRANALAAGLPANFFLTNPDLRGGVFMRGNGGYTRYDSLVVELRRRMAKGLLMEANYTFAKGFSSSRFSFRAPRVNTLSTVLKHAFKANWVYELPFGKNKLLFGDVGGLLDRIIGGWEFNGTTRIQSGNLLDFGNVTLVGMTREQLQDAYKLRFDDANKRAYILPQDIIDNTIKAFSTSATSTTGYGASGPPTGRYIAPANTTTCLQVVTGDCAPQTLYVTGPMFTRVDLSVVKRVKVTERVNFELRGEFLNAFNHINFQGVTCASSAATCGQVTSSYRDVNNTQDPGGRLIQIVARVNF
jgi:hypothetical protein